MFSSYIYKRIQNTENISLIHRHRIDTNLNLYFFTIENEQIQLKMYFMIEGKRFPYEFEYTRCHLNIENQCPGGIFIESEFQLKSNFRIQKHLSNGKLENCEFRF